MRQGDSPGKFTDGAGGSSSGGKGGGKEDDDVPKPGAYGGLWKESLSGTPEGNFAANTATYINQPPQIGIHYRRMMAKMLKDADKFKAAPELKEKIKTKLIDSLWGSLAAAKKKGKQDDVNKIAKALEKLTGKPLNEKTIEIKPVAMPAPKPAPAPEPAKAAPPPAFPAPTEAELAKAKKSVALQLQYVPNGGQIVTATGQAEANKLVAEFNTKYANKEMTSQPALIQKVNDFKALNAKIGSIAAVEKQNMASIVAKEKAAAAAIEAKKNAELMKDPSYAALKGVGGTTSPNHAYIGIAKQSGIDLTPVDAGLLQHYVGSGYAAMNIELYQGIVSPQQFAYRKALEKTLQKFPTVDGYVTRGLKNITATDFEKYKAGHVVPSPAFMSAGKTEKLWGEYTLKIKSKSARDISMLNGEGGGEVIFLPHTAFHVVSKSGKHATLEEL